MGETTAKSLEIDEVKELFTSLKFSDWEIDETFITDGGQATVLGVKNVDGRKGVFRYLKKPDEISKQRFYREIDILTRTEFKHKNIVDLLDYTSNDEHQWYISERGETLTTFWKRQRKKFADDPDELIKSALELIKQISEGLRILHENGVVHRDIKPSNIVILAEGDESYPVLIDFGVIYSDADEERITQVEEAVGNIRYSPDVMMNRMDNIPPWLDIFQLSQLLIWMTQISPVKNWSRPLDWRWVNYDDRLSERTVLSLRAITAQCSEQRLSPQNATEFLSLLDKLFPNATMVKKEKYSINIESIKSGIAEGRAGQDVKLAEDLKAIEASYIIPKQFYYELTLELQSLFSSLREHNLDYEITNVNFEEFYENLRITQKSGENLCTLRFPSKNVEPFFAIVISCHVYLPSQLLQINESHRPNLSNIFTFQFARFGSNNNEIVILRRLTFERDGKISLREDNMNFIRNVGVDEIVQMIREWIEDPTPWKVIQQNAR